MAWVKFHESWHMGCQQTEKCVVNKNSRAEFDSGSNFTVPHGLLPIWHNFDSQSRFLACDNGSLVGLCTQDYKSLCAAVTICSTLVNIQTTHRQTAFWPVYMKSSASWDNKDINTQTLLMQLFKLTPSMPAVPNCCCSKGLALYWSNQPFLIFDIWALWRSGLSARVPKCQKIRKGGLDQYSPEHSEV